MSKEVIEQFREAINTNDEWQEEVRNFGDDDNMVNYASGKGYEFTNDDYNAYVAKEFGGELSEFETEMVAGGQGMEDSSYYHGPVDDKITSDKRLKEDIKKVGTLDNGLPVYTYKYKGKDTYHMGVMAQELEKVNPKAVHNDKQGYKYVDYRSI